MTICLFKLLNKETLIGELVNESLDHVVVKRPLLVEETINPSSGLSNVLLTSYAPFAATNDLLLTFSKIHVVQAIPVHDEVIKYYHNSILYNEKIESSMVKRLADVNHRMEDALGTSSIKSSESEGDDDSEEFVSENMFRDISKAIH